MSASYYIQCLVVKCLSITTISGLLICLLVNPIQASRSQAIPPGYDAGAILARDRWIRMNPWYFFSGPVSIDDFRPKEPVIIDNYHLLPEKYHQDVHGLLLPEDIEKLEQ